MSEQAGTSHDAATTNRATQAQTNNSAPSARRVAVVTGAGSGIGRAVALALYAEGYSVVLAGRRAEALAETQRQANDAGDRMSVV